MSILREHTNEKHRAVENTEFVQYMLHGNITADDYAVYLQQFHAVYSAIENHAEQAGMLTDLPDIKRADRIRQDIEEQGYPVLPEDQLLPAVQRWCQRIRDLYNSDQQDQIFAHVYVRHMGDMYGGKVIAKRVPGSGRSYEFADRPALIKAFDAKLNLSLLDEALRAFDLAGELFEELQQELTNGRTKINGS
jgi:heme oxygenase (biliverdin-producing, ferredoxin)